MRWWRGRVWKDAGMNCWFWFFAIHTYKLHLPTEITTHDLDEFNSNYDFFFFLNPIRCLATLKVTEFNRWDVKTKKRTSLPVCPHLTKSQTGWKKTWKIWIVRNDRQSGHNICVLPIIHPMRSHWIKARVPPRATIESNYLFICLIIY